MAITLKEAIEIMNLPRDDRHFILYEKERQAEKLLIEAGKTIERNRQNHPDVRFSLLPGETKE